MKCTTTLSTLSKHLALQRNLQTRRYFSADSLPQPFRVLALESSCDDSCAGVISSDRKILSHVVIKQTKVHQKYGGIHPMEAVVAHQANMPQAIRQALEEARCSVSDIDAFAYTRGPGIRGCLAVGATSAKALAAVTGKPSVGVHHMQAHALTPMLTETDPPEYPFLTLLVSGGHTMVVLASSSTEFEVLANTVDEPVGHAIDGAVRTLKIPWDLGSGTPGSALEAYLLQNPIPDDQSSNQPTSMDRLVSKQPEPLDEQTRVTLSHLYVKAAFQQLTDKVCWWLKDLAAKGVKVRAVVASGGVASNRLLRDSLQASIANTSALNSLPTPRLIFPPVHLCTDNAAMIGWVAIDMLQRGKTTPWNSPVIAKWPLEKCEEEVEDGRRENKPKA